MPIQLDEHYSIEADKYQVILKFERSEMVKGELRKSRHHTFHATLAQALQKYCALALVGSEDIKAVVERVEALNAKIDALFADIRREHLKL